MSGNKDLSKALLLLLTIPALVECSSIIEGRSQELVINTDPPGATCNLMRNNLSIGNVSPTPGSVLVGKTKYDIFVKCTKEGYQEATYHNKSGSAGAAFGNVVPIGWAVDSATGADNEYDSPVNIVLPPEEKPMAYNARYHHKSIVTATAVPDVPDAEVGPIDGPEPEASIEGTAAPNSVTDDGPVTLVMGPDEKPVISGHSHQLMVKRASAPVPAADAPRPEASTGPITEPQPEASAEGAAAPISVTDEGPVTVVMGPDEKSMISDHSRRAMEKETPASASAIEPQPEASMAPVTEPQPEASMTPANASPQPEASMEGATAAPEEEYDGPVNLGVDEEKPAAPVHHHHKKTVVAKAALPVSPPASTPAPAPVASAPVPATPAPAPVAAAAPTPAPVAPAADLVPPAPSEPIAIQLDIPSDKSQMVSDKE